MAEQSEKNIPLPSPVDATESCSSAGIFDAMAAVKKIDGSPLLGYIDWSEVSAQVVAGAKTTKDSANTPGNQPELYSPDGGGGGKIGNQPELSSPGSLPDILKLSFPDSKGSGKIRAQSFGLTDAGDTVEIEVGGAWDPSRNRPGFLRLSFDQSAILRGLITSSRSAAKT